jgi:hypothetical protein
MATDTTSNDELEAIAAEVHAVVETLVTEDDTPVDNVFSEKQQRLHVIGKETLLTALRGPPVRHREAHQHERSSMRAARMKYLVAITVVVLVYAAETCWGGEFVEKPDWQIIAESEVVAEGEVVTIFPPPDVSGKVRGESVARIKLAAVFKGTVKPGETVDFTYVSHKGLRLDPPAEYTAGEKLTVTLRSRMPLPGGQEASNVPAEWAKAPWMNTATRDFAKRVARAEFRERAAIWNAPSEYLKDPKLRSAAAYFVSEQGKLPDAELVSLLASNDPLDRLAGAQVAQHTKSEAALKPLVELLGSLHLRSAIDYVEGRWDLTREVKRAIAGILDANPADPDLLEKAAERVKSLETTGGKNVSEKAPMKTGKE